MLICLFCPTGGQKQKDVQAEATWCSTPEKASWLLSFIPRCWINGSGPKPKTQFGVRFWLVFDDLGMRLAYPANKSMLAWTGSSCPAEDKWVQMMDGWTDDSSTISYFSAESYSVALNAFLTCKNMATAHACYICIKTLFYVSFSPIR